jgi:phosphatidylglycerophosphate synthase
VTASLGVLAAVLALAFTSMGAFALVRPAKDEDAVRKGSRLFLGAGDFLIHWFLWAISPAERFFLARGATPDHFNAAGLVCGLASGVLIGLGRLELGGWAIALSGVADILDGRIARARGVASPYGRFIDSTLDRFVETFTFLGFAWYLRGRTWGPFLATAAIAGSLLVSYAQARGETVGVSGSGGLMQRAERMVLSCLVCLFDPAVSAWVGWRPGTLVVGMLALMAVTTFGTAVYRTVWIALRLRR